MSVYVDTSVIVSFLSIDANHRRARQAVEALSERPTISTWTMAEFASVARRNVRDSRVPRMGLQSIFVAFDSWCRRVDVAAVIDQDMRVAFELLRDGVRPLKAPDALHIAVCQRLGANLLTFDGGMAAVAKEIGVPVVAA